MLVPIIETNLQFRYPLGLRKSTNYIVLHHAAARQATVYDVHRWHLERTEPDGTKWSGIGYHFFVDKSGSVYRGRPEDSVGAHVYNYNTVSIGICVEGNYDEEEKMPIAQRRVIILLTAQLRKSYPQAKVVGHKDLAATRCPGRNFPLSEVIDLSQSLALPNIVPWAAFSVVKALELRLVVNPELLNESEQKVLVWFDRLGLLSQGHPVSPGETEN